MKYYDVLAIIDDVDRADWLIKELLKTPMAKKSCRWSNLGRAMIGDKAYVIDFSRSHLANYTEFHRFKEEMDRYNPNGQYDDSYEVEPFDTMRVGELTRLVNHKSFGVTRATRIALGLRVKNENGGWSEKFYMRERFQSPYKSFPF